MGTERIAILEMLTAGTITAEQADELLDALEPEPAPVRASHVTRTTDAPTRTGNRMSKDALHRLTQARIHGVDQNYIRELKQEGITDLSLDELVRLSIHGVNARYIRDMRAAGFGDLSADQLAKLSIHGVTPEYIRQMQEIGFVDLDVDDLKQMAIHGVDREFVEQMADLATAGEPSPDR